MTTWSRTTIVLATVAMALGSSLAAAEMPVTIGTGGVTGVYYPIGGAICRLVNKAETAADIHCTAKRTEGSVRNLEGLRSGEFNLAVVQSDWQHHAHQGSSTFADAGPHTEMRALFSVVPEPFTVIVRPEAKITSFDQLQGRRVNVGNPGSGQRATMEVVMAAKGWDMGDFAGVAEFGSSVQANELCRDKFDAAVFTAAHPSLSVMEAIAACDAELVPATGPKIDQLVAANPHYVAAPIPGDAYETVPDPLPSFGVVATVVATSEMSAEVVYEMVKAVFENLDEFRRLHPAFTNLDRDFMLSSHHTAPLHEGAVRYFQEVGVM